MVASADNLNLDVLELIFSFLSANDLPSVALVSKAFLAGVLPRLYHTITFSLRQTKRFPNIVTPFSTILRSREIAVHVRVIDVQAPQAIPAIKSVFHPDFMRVFVEAISLCPNLEAFSCTLNVIPMLLGTLPNKDRLQTLKMHAALSTEQAKSLLQIAHLRNLTLEFATWMVLNILPDWVTSMKGTLTTLTLFQSDDLNETILDDTLSRLPALTGLHVVACPKINYGAIVRLLKHTPLLESLSFSVLRAEAEQPNLTQPLYQLRQISVNLNYTVPIPPPTVLIVVFRAFERAVPNLSTIKIRSVDPTVIMSSALVNALLDAYSATLQKLAFINCPVGYEAINAMCRHCPQLEHLELPLVTRDCEPLYLSLSTSSTLKTLVDSSDTHANHGATFSSQNARDVFCRTRSLTKIMKGTRIWTCRRSNGNVTEINLTRRRVQTPKDYWFMPS